MNNKALLQINGPLILAVNHPNSFLDAIILATLFDNTVYSLARGDAFTTKRVKRFLNALHILPVYRQREGAENLHLNYTTFDACVEIFKRNGIVLIFIEAQSENEWQLRPLKKGTARLAMAAWQQGIPVKILPVGLNYSSFTLFGKNVDINIGELIEAPHLPVTSAEPGKLLNLLTGTIEKQLRRLVYIIGPADTAAKAALLGLPVTNDKKTALAVPAFLGLVTHAPIYFPAKWLITKKFIDTGHCDAILTSFLILAYPVYISLAALILFYAIPGWWWLSAFIALPFFAWSYVQLSKQID